MLPTHGEHDGGSSTASSPSYTSSSSAPSRTSGALVTTTEDKSFRPCFWVRFANLFATSTLAMSDELAQDEEDAEDYDLEAIQSRTQRREEDDDDDRTLVGARRGGHEPLPGENVVFDIGNDDEDDDDDAPKKPQQQQRKQSERLSGDNEDYRPVHGRNSEERQDLMGRSRDD